MKTLLKVLGIAAGAYCLLDLGALIGAGGTVEMYEHPESEASKFYKENNMLKTAKWANRIMFNNPKESSKKRSEVLHDYAEQWAKKGYSSEEIKQGLDALKKELD